MLFSIYIQPHVFRVVASRSHKRGLKIEPQKYGHILYGGKETAKISINLISTLIFKYVFVLIPLWVLRCEKPALRESF